MISNETFLQSLELFKKTIQSRTDINDTEFALGIQFVKMRHFEKNEMLVREGEVENHVYFIIDGVTRSFFFKEDKEISFEFYFAGSFISSYSSFLNRTPSEHAIEAFTPITAFVIAYEDLAMLIQQVPKAEQIRRIFTEELFKKSSDRVKDLISLSATERYVKLLNAYPQYVRNIPLKYLASYLNITPESLSRIRKSI